MNENEQLEQFAENLLQEVIARAEAEDEGAFRVEEFTRLAMDYVAEAGEIDDAFVSHYQARGIKASGYSISEDNDRLDLFISEPRLSGIVESVPESAVRQGFQRLQAFLQKALQGYHKDLEEASDGFDMAWSIWQARNEISQIRLFFLTDGLTRIEQIENVAVDGMEVSHHVWDLRRIYRSAVSGRGHEPIEIDFAATFGRPVPCLMFSPGTDQYRCLLAMIPATMLVELYSRFGPRLLERNVRSFLHLRAGVNKGIRKTIQEEPEMFLAYNNGLSVTAEGLDVRDLGNGQAELLRARDFQIVNGGQTTGSLFRAFKKDKCDIDPIMLPVKITELFGEKSVEDIAPQISLYANSQTKVNMADFSSNNPFHVRVEELSRTVWAPPAQGMQKQTRWYYERARGQYLDDKSRESTPARKKAFEAINPRRQVITKTDLAKFENTWSQLPHIVSKGAQKNFIDFMDRLERRGNFNVDEAFFRRMVAKAILFRQTERIVSAQKFGGYRANIVTYTLARISHETAQRINLEKIWNDQCLSPALEAALEDICHKAHSHITSPPNNQNITEWCKKELCWDQFRDAQITLPATLNDELLKNTPSVPKKPQHTVDEPTPEEIGLINEIAQVPPEIWFGLAKWAKETQNLQPWQRKLAFNLGKLAGRGSQPTRKQANQGKKITEEAERLGFSLRSDAAE